MNGSGCVSYTPVFRFRNVMSTKLTLKNEQKKRGILNGNEACILRPRVTNTGG